MKTTQHPLTSLQQTVKQLRSPEGCPWDRKQTVRSLKKYLHEEFEEIIYAIDHEDQPNLCEELGDFLYLIVMVSEISEGQGHFSLEDVIASVDEKLIRRHPHVFDKSADLDEDALRNQWLRIKREEKLHKSS